MASGVGAAHQEGVIHRDLKPANVLLRKKDKVAKVTDFGIALVPSDTSRPQTRGILGSLWYMSPEQVTGRRDLDQRVDVYALGIMLYQMLIGRVPFDAKSDYDIMKLHAEAPMPLASAIRPDVPAAVDELIQKACARTAPCASRPARRRRRRRPCPLPAAAADPAGRDAGGVDAGHPAGPPGGRPRASPGDRQRARGRPASRSAPTLTHSSPGVAPTAEEVPPVLPRRRSKAPWIALAVVVLLAGGAGAVLAMGPRPGRAVALQGQPPPAGRRRRPRPGAPRCVRRTPAPARRPWRPSPAPGSATAASSRRVISGSDLEFRVKKPDHFKGQGYEVGEARFVLRATAEPGVFAVEDRIRPVPPTGKTYDARARGTCQEVWTQAGGEPLRARYDGSG